ncbi:hypothetical protein [Halorussus sp. MSC15.2]|uniref:hypothetical protein n=1 Tax=Halorussus sp. MSC15.2 TaxID=2283638 RepID=UPI0013D8D24A|nr:hypothetical protein [Halorussus sp. MSC15.2]NEU58635.1 hypothetical protein [Halorussus sp. MSC15.2]
MARDSGTLSTLVSWVRTTDWLWMIIGGFYLLAYLFWYIPALAKLPRSVRNPPEQFPWHWPLDFVSTGLSGGVLVGLGFRRATAFTDETRDGEPGRRESE